MRVRRDLYVECEDSQITMSVRIASVYLVYTREEKLLYMYWMLLRQATFQ